MTDIATITVALDRAELVETITEIVRDAFTAGYETGWDEAFGRDRSGAFEEFMLGVYA